VRVYNDWKMKVITGARYIQINAGVLAKCYNSGKKRHLLFFCPERLAIVRVSGIITTNLGKAATTTRIAGRKKTDTSLQNMPFFLTEEGLFFCLCVFV